MLRSTKLGFLFPGEDFPGADPCGPGSTTTRVSTVAPALTSKATSGPPPGSEGGLVDRLKETTSSTILREISKILATKPPPHKDTQPATSTKCPAASKTIEEKANHDNRKEPVEDRGSKDNKHETPQYQSRTDMYGRDLCPPSKETEEDENSTPMSLSTPSPFPPRTQHSTPSSHESTAPRICGNCSATGHTLSDCTLNLDAHGFLNGCPRCNTRAHLYANCSAVKYRDDDYFYLVKKRHGKPPVRWDQDFRFIHVKRFAGEGLRSQTAQFASEGASNDVVQGVEEVVLGSGWYTPSRVVSQIHPEDVFSLGGVGARGAKDKEKGGKQVVDLTKAENENPGEWDGGVLARQPASFQVGGVGQTRSAGQSKNLALRGSMGKDGRGGHWQGSSKKRKGEDLKSGRHAPGLGMVDHNHSSFNPPKGPKAQLQTGGGQHGGKPNARTNNLPIPAPYRQEADATQFVAQYWPETNGPGVKPQNDCTPQNGYEAQSGQQNPGYEQQQQQEYTSQATNTSLYQTCDPTPYSRQHGYNNSSTPCSNFSSQNNPNSIPHPNTNPNPNPNSRFTGTGALPPAQPLSRPGMQPDNLRAQAAKQYGGFGVRHGFAATPAAGLGPIEARVAGRIAERGVGRRRGRGRGRAERKGDMGMHTSQHPPGAGHGKPQPQPRDQSPQQPPHQQANATSKTPPKQARAPGPGLTYAPPQNYQIKGRAAPSPQSQSTQPASQPSWQSVKASYAQAQAYQQSTPTGNARAWHQAPTKNGGANSGSNKGQGPGRGERKGDGGSGYCVDCKNHGPTIEECEMKCTLCREGDHLPKECRYFGRV